MLSRERRHSSIIGSLKHLQLRNYRYAGELLACRQLLWSFGEIQPRHFDFELYASGE